MDYQYYMQRNVEMECIQVDNLSFIMTYNVLFNLTTSVVNETCLQRHTLYILSYLRPAFYISYPIVTNVLLL
jgi:hypothetical protein